MKNPLSLLKKAAVNFLKSPAKTLIYLLVLFDGVSKVKGHSSTDNDCHEITFTPTASGQSYAMESRTTSCTELEVLSQFSQEFCVSALRERSEIRISSLTDVPRTDRKTGIEFQDVLGFSVTDEHSAAIVGNADGAATKLWKGIKNPRCASVTFFKKVDCNDKSIQLIDSSPENLRYFVDRKKIYVDAHYQHCLEQDPRSCKMEL